MDFSALQKESSIEGREPPRCGMEQGYAMSEMATLQREYLSESETHDSTFEGVKWMVSKTELLPNDVRDRGISNTRPIPRFALDPKLLARVTRITGELQAFLKSVSQLISGRNSYFIVDPEDTSLPILQGASSLAQLNASWQLLRKRMELGNRFFSKYQEEYTQGTLLFSPASTNPELLGENLANQGDEDQRLRYLYSKIPHHRNSISSEQAERFEYNYTWGGIMPVSETLEQSFPARDPEDYPLVVQYDTIRGVRKRWPFTRRAAHEKIQELLCVEGNRDLQTEKGPSVLRI
ncbi:hypothetical protein B0H11DRAFT_1739388 [Mycena galericulata]|nr:hypothetical protein B0H11DRAFT_1739388 [Mycena galericulata]